ncbi:MAG: hypothetical protein AAGA96_04835 [Verrucomicrobiota bacterium]
MDPFWLLIPVFLLLFWLTDKLIEKPTNRLLSLVGLDILHGGSGPLESNAIIQDERMIVQLSNGGKDRFRLGSVVATGSGKKPYFPVPYLRDDDFGERDPNNALKEEFGSIILKPGESLEFTLSVSELSESGCRQVEIVNRMGRSWSVEGFPGGVPA